MFMNQAVAYFYCCFLLHALGGEFGHKPLKDWRDSQ